MLRKEAAEYIKRHQLGSEQEDVYEFGVYTGDSIKTILDHFPSNKYRCIWGFDSFQGIPAEENKFNPEEWKEGFCSAKEALGVNDVQAAHDKVCEKLGSDRVEFIVGYYHETLAPKVLDLSTFRPAIYVDIDVDLYISAFTVLDFMLYNKLIVPGTLIGFDDWGTENEGKWGESKAWTEMCKIYGIVAEQIWEHRSPPHQQKLFKVISIKE